jgi:cell division initiation protein
MSGEKRFRRSFMGGFKKRDVNAYIEKMLKEFDDKLKEKDDEIASIKSQNKDFKAKYEDLFKRADHINEDRAKIADVLIKAQEKAQMMLEDAKQEALDEKKELEGVIEQEKEKLVDIKKELKRIKSEVITVLKKYENQLGSIIKEDDKQ